MVPGASPNDDEIEKEKSYGSSRQPEIASGYLFNEPNAANLFEVRDDKTEFVPAWKKEEERIKARFISGDALLDHRKGMKELKDEINGLQRQSFVETAEEREERETLEKEFVRGVLKDPEYVYALSLEREAKARREGDIVQADFFKNEAKEARSCIPQLNLNGMWIGKYGEHGYEMINITYSDDVLIATKVTGDKNVPKGEMTFKVDLGLNLGNLDKEHKLVEMASSVSKQWGMKYLQIFEGKGQVAAEGFKHNQWIDGQLVLLGKYFSFVWLPINHQVFFARPGVELTLKMLRRSQEQEDENKSELQKKKDIVRRLWTETLLMEDKEDLRLSEEQEEIFQ
eukprot:CAMPEP_0118681350 /NCGR_PEP_ID=MMETSP0800-20121206/4887_1 /TAXON_ID=210618 ORGANISM="Striatella unipunctata, Strain CCMP2910" /NCGR_SAMPLE_ID=MMETSP0800 /ASSEMBLY_ACC=CAM_ASM_000638 /LENGTH=340 /DNA_ID=CAMNT_0006577631 /DNA_START=177 /DNA_END=1199 /DNA_ORIENTATION=-